MTNDYEIDDENELFVTPGKSWKCWDGEHIWASLCRLRANGLIRPADGDGWYLLTAEGANRYYDYLGEDDAE